MKRNQKIIVLWLMTMGGLACHTLTDLLPMFWGESIAIADGPAPQAMLVMMASLAYLLPVCGILCLIGDKPARPLRLTNAVLACIIALFNVVHACMELPADNYGQYIVMPLLVVVGALLVWHSVMLAKREEA